MRKEEIKITVELDDNNIPEKLHWQASDSDKGAHIKAMILSVWDEREQNTMRMDLWNKEMQVDEMKQFVHQTLITLADSFERATNEKKMADTLRDFCDYYAEKMEIRKPQ